MKRVLQVVVLLVSLTGLIGCGESGILDFFESGFADGDNGNNNNNNDNLTLEDLAGDWSLDREVSTIVLIATWNNGTVGPDFLKDVITDPRLITQVRISEDTLEFLDQDNNLLGPKFTYQISTANTLSLASSTSGTPTRELTTSFDGSGTRLTLNDGTTDASFDADTLVIVDYTLHIAQDQFESSIALSDDSTDDVMETLEIAGSSTIKLTEGTTSINVTTTLSNNDTLRLDFSNASSHDRRGTAVFTK